MGLYLFFIMSVANSMLSSRSTYHARNCRGRDGGNRSLLVSVLRLSSAPLSSGL